METTITLTVDTDDQSAAESAFRSAFIRRTAEIETEGTQIASVVNGLFDDHLGQSLKMPWLASAACQKLNVQPESFGVLSERVLDYVRANAKDGGPFRIVKGKLGGAYRVVDRSSTQ